MSEEFVSKEPLSETARVILQRFLEDYPTSAQLRGGRKLRKAGWEGALPRIAHDPEAKEAFLIAAEELETRGVLSIRWARYRRGDRIEALYLEDPALLYELFGLPAPEQRREKALELIDAFRREQLPWMSAAERGPEGFVHALIEHLRGRIEAYIPTPCEEPEVLTDLLSLFCADRSLIAELPLRALSIRLYGDSKRLERILPEADRLALAAAGERMSSRYGLIRSYPQVGIRGHGELLFGDGRLWSLEGEDIFCGLECLERLSLVSVSGPVLVVENKETFMRLPLQRHGFSALIYGGGHLNHAAAVLLKLLEKSGVELAYFGDLDPEGLLIFQEAEALLSGGLTPWHMSCEEYLRYLEFGYPLPEEALVRLGRLKHGRFGELVSLMYSHRRGVEQEVMGCAWET